MNKRLVDFFKYRATKVISWMADQSTQGHCSPYNMPNINLIKKIRKTFRNFVTNQFSCLEYIPTYSLNSFSQKNVPLNLNQCLRTFLKYLTTRVLPQMAGRVLQCNLFSKRSPNHTLELQAYCIVSSNSLRLRR